jgi:hypothetical protein
VALRGRDLIAEWPKVDRGRRGFSPEAGREGNNSSMACSRNFPPLITVNGERQFWSSSGQGTGLGSFRGSDGTL